MVEKFSTPYSRAWEAFTESGEFTRLVAASTKNGEGEKYTINRICSGEVF